jgi:hypothetical protein
MTGGVCLVPPSGGGLGRGLGDVRGSSGCDQYAPVNFIYRSFHDSIRSELESLLEGVLALEPTSPADGLVTALERLRERYRFLEQVYKCHSTLEDEVRCVVLEGLGAVGLNISRPCIRDPLDNVILLNSIQMKYHRSEDGEHALVSV